MKKVGERVTIRDFVLDDAEAAAAIIGDDRVTNWLSFDSRPAAAATAMMERAIEMASLDPRTEYYLGITPIESDRVVGFVRLELTGVKAAKLGFAINADYWGHGYAPEAAALIVAFGFDELGLHRISAAVGPENERSLRLVERLGFVHEGTIRDHVFTNGAWRASHLYSILESEHQAAS
ncbi:MAG: GNAT family protein [Actinomycetota bacterium]